MENILSKPSDIELEIIGVLKNKYYVASIRDSGFEKKTILYNPNRLRRFPTFLCKNQSITIISPDNRESFFEFLKRYDYFYLKLGKCDVTNEKFNLSLETKHRVESILKESKLIPSSQEIAMGFVFGDLSYINKEFKNASKEGGIIHLFAASGLHLGIILGVFGYTLEKFFKMNYYISKVVPIFFGFIYLYLLGFPISLSRAYFFACFWVITKVTYRKSNPLNMMIICTTLISLFQNDNFLSIGFNLSMGAVIGIFYLKPPLDKLLFSDHKNFFTENITVSLSAGLGTYFLLLYYFKSFSYGSLFLNILIVPIASLTLPILFLTVIVNLLQVPIFGELLWTLCDFLLRLVIFLTFTLSEKISFYRIFKGDINFLYFSYLILIIYIYIFYFYKNINIVVLKFFQSSSIEKCYHTIKVDTYSTKSITLDRNIIKLFKPLNLKFLNLLFKLLDSTKRILERTPILFVIFIFFISSYNFEEINHKEKYESFFKVGLNSYIIESNNALYIEGDCKYFNKILKKLESKENCSNFVEVHISNLSCLSNAIKCSPNIPIFMHPPYHKSKYYTSISKEIEVHFPEVRVEKEIIPRYFSNKKILFYAPHLDDIEKLYNLPKESEGIIVLQLPYHSRDKSKEWNDNKNLLRIPDTWKFYTYDEL
jgi:ComEC/Rec2-related protein